MTSRFVKPVMLFGCLLLLAFDSSAQDTVLKFRTTSLSTSVMINGEWSEWNDPEEASILVTYDSNKERWTLYSSKTQVYDVATHHGDVSESETQTDFRWFCIDEDGIECTVRHLRTIVDDQYTHELYIYWANLRIGYFMYMLD